MIERQKTSNSLSRIIVTFLPLFALLLMAFGSVGDRMPSVSSELGKNSQHQLDTLISGKRLMIKDINQYDPSFVKGLKLDLDYKTIKVIDDSLYYTYRPNTKQDSLVTFKYSIPTNLKLNEAIPFTVVSENKPFTLVLKRTNYTNLEYKLKREEKTIKSGVAILQSTFYFGAEGQDDENGKPIYLRQYIDPNKCGAIVQVEISQAKIASITWCIDDKNDKWITLPIFRRR